MAERPSSLEPSLINESGEITPDFWKYVRQKSQPYIDGVSPMKVVYTYDAQFKPSIPASKINSLLAEPMLIPAIRPVVETKLSSIPKIILRRYSLFASIR